MEFRYEVGARMNIEYHKWFSPNLNREMELKVYGHFGKPALVFPCAGGSFHEFEDFKMLDVISHFIEDGSMKVFTIGSNDNQSWLNKNLSASERGKRHNDYDRYVVREVVPFIHNHVKFPMPLLCMGVSLGAYHALNFHLRHPEIVDASISLSGIYSMKRIVGEFFDDSVYFNSPLEYLPGFNDEYYLSRFRKNKIMVCVGQGAWEEDCFEDTKKLKEILEAKKIPALIEIWGHDVNHDWPWWHKQMPYFLAKFFGR